MKAMFTAMLDCLLHLRQGDASYSMVDVTVGLSEVERGDDGGLQIVPLREQRWGILGPGCEEGIRIEFCRTNCLSLRPFGWWHVQSVFASVLSGWMSVCGAVVDCRLRHHPYGGYLDCSHIDYPTYQGKR